MAGRQRQLVLLTRAVRRQDGPDGNAFSIPIRARSARRSGRPRAYVLLMIPVDPRVRRQAGDTNGGGRRRRDGASWLALTNIGSGRYVPFSENPPGQPVALECPECPRGGVRPAAEFVRQFCLRRQLGPRRVFAAPDPPREHGVNVLVGPRVLPRIIHDLSHGQCNDPSPGGLLVFHLEHPRVAAPTDV